MKENIWSILVAIGMVIGVLLYMTAYTVPQGSQAIKMRLGSFYGDVIRKPGLGMKWPNPIERVVILDARTRVMSVTPDPVTTKDENTIIPSIAITWKITDIKDYLTSLGNEQSAENNIRARAEGVRQQVFNKFNLSEIISPDQKIQPKNYKQLEESLLKALRDGIAQSNYGVAIESLEITGLALPTQSTQKVADRMIAERQRRSMETVADGQNEKQQIINKAQLERQKAISQAQAEALRIRGEADAAAAQFYKVYKENPDLANFLMRLDTLQAILSDKATITLPVDNPLDALIESAPSIQGRGDNE